MIRIALHTGPRAELRALFEEADDSAEALDGYIDAGRVLVARDGDRAVGHLQITETASATERELKSMAVAESHRRLGIGARLVEAALELARADGARTMCVSTATADIGNLRFYQRSGFRMRSIDRDAFTAATGYDDVVIDGIPLCDRIWFDRPLLGDPFGAGA